MTPSVMSGFNARAILAIIAVLLASFFFALKRSPQLSRSVEVDNDIRMALNTVFDANELLEAEDKFNALEKDLTGTFDTLPKNSLGRLTPRAVRHIVATYFGKEHGLFIKGLEPHGMQRASCEALHDVSILRDRAPGFARALVEARLYKNGLSLEEVASVILVLEHLITDDHQDLMKTMYPLSNVSLADDLDVTTMKEVLKHYMLSLWNGVQNNKDPKVMQDLVQASEKDGSIEAPMFFIAEFLDKPAYINRDRTNPFVPRLFSFEAASRVVRQLAGTYGKWQDESCVKMKMDLKRLDPNSSGRIPLASLYGSEDSAVQFFSESESYLKEIGALDLTVPENPEVIIPNYVQGPSNCVAPFPYYSICCLRECDVLISQIEGQILTSAAEPEKILSIVRNLSTSTIEAPRKMQTKLVSKLWTIADHHGGHVPLHGRLFAQWMHYAFPWECPYPAVVNPDALTAKYWKEHSTDISAVDLAHYRKLAKQLGKPDVSAATLKQWTDEEILPIEEVREPILPVILSALWSFCRLAAQAALCLGMLRALWTGWQTLSRARQQWREDQSLEDLDDFRKPRSKVDQRSRREAQRRRVIEQPKRNSARSGQSESQRSPLAPASNLGACVTTGVEANASPNAISGTSVSRGVEGDVSHDVSDDASFSRAVRETCTYCGHVGSDCKYVSTLCVSGCTTHIHKTCWRQRHGGFTLDCAPCRCACGELLEHIEVYEHVGETEETRLVHTIQNGVVEETLQPEVAVIPPAGRRKKVAVKRQAAPQQAENHHVEVPAAAPALMPLVENFAEEPPAPKPVALAAASQSTADNLAEEPPSQKPVERIALTAASRNTAENLTEELPAQKTVEAVTLKAAYQSTAVNFAEDPPSQKPVERAPRAAATQSTAESLAEKPPAQKPVEPVGLKATYQSTSVNFAEDPPAEKPVEPVAYTAATQSTAKNLTAEPKAQKPVDPVALQAAYQSTAVNFAEDPPAEKPVEPVACTAASRSSAENLTGEPPAQRTVEPVALTAAYQSTAVNFAEDPLAQKPMDTGKIEQIGDDRRFIAKIAPWKLHRKSDEQTHSKAKSYVLPPAPQGLPPPAPQAGWDWPQFLSSRVQFGKEMQLDQPAPPPGLEMQLDQPAPPPGLERQALPPPGLLLPHNLSTSLVPILEMQHNLSSLPPGMNMPQRPSSLAPPGLGMPQRPSTPPPGLDGPQGAIRPPPGLEMMRMPPGLFLEAESMTATSFSDAPPGLEDPKPDEKFTSSMALFGTPFSNGAEQQGAASMLDESSAIAKAQHRWSKQRQADGAPRDAFRFQ